MKSDFACLPHAGPEELVELWNRACGRAHPLSHAIWSELTLSDPSFEDGDLTVVSGPLSPHGTRRRVPIAGFALAKRLRRPILGGDVFADVGYLSLLAVDPAFARQGVGSTLLTSAEDALRRQGARRIAVGESFFHAVPGVPEGLPGAIAFFERGGYRSRQTVWDLMRDVRDFVLPAGVRASLVAGPFEALAIQADRSMSVDPIHTAALLEFLAAEFPGRWLYDVSVAFGRGDTPAAAMAVFDGPRIVAFAQMHLPGSAGARRWVGFDPQVAAIGPVGVARSHRGRGLGIAVVALAADFLRRRHARRVVIDWTDLRDFYGRLGFTPWLSYRLMDKAL